MSGDRRRELILQAAFGLFSKRGFSGTTTKDIAKASGVSEAMVYKHFASKDELYGAILHDKKGDANLQRPPWEENTELIAAMEVNDDFGVFFHFAIRALDKQQEDIEFMRMIFYSALEEHEMADTFFTEFVGKLYEFLGTYIKKRQKDGALRKIEPKIVVRAFMGMLIHHSLNNILWDKKRTILNITNKEAAKNFAELILNGAKLQAV
jgi:AcrR family transcriptional regulator